MIYSTPTLTKEQYERLTQLDDDKDFTTDRKQHAFGDKLSSFLKEHVGKVSSNNAYSDVNFYKLFERVS